jgi:hypothetical protein
MKTVNQLIDELQSLTGELRGLPVVVQAPNGEFFEAEVKQMFSEYESPLTGARPKKIVITY